MNNCTSIHRNILRHQKLGEAWANKIYSSPASTAILVSSTAVRAKAVVLLLYLLLSPFYGGAKCVVFGLYFRMQFILRNLSRILV